MHRSQVVIRKSREEEEKKTYKQTILEYKQSLGSHPAGQAIKGKKIGRSPLVVKENEEDSEGRAFKRGEMAQAATVH